MLLQQENLLRQQGDLEERQGNLVNALVNTFRSELLRTKVDVATMWLFERFSKNKFSDTVLNANTLHKLIIIEQLFSSVYAYHTSAQKYKQEIQEQTKQAFSEIEDLLKKVEGQGEDDDENNMMIKKYLRFRKAEFEFYRGYTLSGKERKECFYNAVKDYWSSQDSNNIEVEDTDSTKIVELKLFSLLLIILLSC